MYALVETSGRQYWVRSGEKFVVDRIEAEVGSEIVLDKVLLLGSEPAVVGTPVVAGACVRAQVVDHHQGRKVHTFKYVRRHRVRHQRTSRAHLTTLVVTAIEKA